MPSYACTQPDLHDHEPDGVAQLAGVLLPHQVHNQRVHLEPAGSQARPGRAGGGGHTIRGVAQACVYERRSEVNAVQPEPQ